MWNEVASEVDYQRGFKRRGIIRWLTLAYHDLPSLASVSILRRYFDLLLKP
jgi:hypothetical protein